MKITYPFDEVRYRFGLRLWDRFWERYSFWDRFWDWFEEQNEVTK